MSRSAAAFAALLAAVIALAPAPPPAAPRAAGTVRADTLWSQALGIRKQYVVYLPPSYAQSPARRYPVVYYLHGLWGDEWNWVRQGRLDATMDSLVAAGAPEMILVMPDGDDGWYTTWNTLPDYFACRRAPPPHVTSADGYCVPWTHYDDYVARDLVAHVDSAYRTVARRGARGIAGLSMGGYGAVSLALAYPDVFAAAASHSGVLSPLFLGPVPFRAPARYAPAVDSLRPHWPASAWPLIVPAFGRDTAAWWARDPARLARRARDAGAPLPALFVDTGRDDALVADQNRAFDAELTALGVPHRYAEWPGAHTWTYWRAHAAESLRWFGETLR